MDEALQRAYASRSDYQAASATLRAAEYSKKSARAEYYPSLSFSGDYGVAGTYSTLATHGVFDVRGTLSIPIFQGGKVHGDELVADAQLEESRQKLENLRGQIDADVRTAFFNLESSAEQVAVAKSNIDLAQQTLDQSRDRFAAGVTDTVEVVQSQEQVASANDSYINSLYNFNYAKISLARAMGLEKKASSSTSKENKPCRKKPNSIFRKALRHPKRPLRRRRALRLRRRLPRARRDSFACIRARR